MCVTQHKEDCTHKHVSQTEDMWQRQSGIIILTRMKNMWQNYGVLTHLAPDSPSPPALLPYRETPDRLVAAG